ncbi:MAG TPA: MlaE family lipid ABC transporter permease subunit [Gammaproteobacteria bacterium]|nr:MlaE family lipid ABC transporter permease subunit [Gammaproteobacteria bacterium]
MKQPQNSRAGEDADLQMAGVDRLRCSGSWTVQTIGALDRRLSRFPWPAATTVTLDGTAVDRLDTAGAWLLVRTRRQLEGLGKTVQLTGFGERHQTMVDTVAETGPEQLPAGPRYPGLLEGMGRLTVDALGGMLTLLSFMGECVLHLLATIVRPWRVRWRAVVADMRTAGVNALLIAGLLSFLMGIVIAYQGAAQLQLYGASIYVADLVGLSMLRELAPMLTAIIVAGRTGSAYAAQIGTMQVTEEVSALRTIGIPPIDQLVLPKMLSLIIALPLLSVFADLMGILGGMLMVKLKLGIGAFAYLDRLQHAVTVRSFMLGLGKTPVFAVIIAVIGSYQGFRVQGGAESVGHHTTMAVVQSIFLVIMTDALFSILFSWLGI